jgi:phosphoenolpyruvate---glycerone phosphotransferase subunit DhaL
MGASMDAACLRAALKRAAEAARQGETTLNAADAHMGDGDTGITVRRLFEALDHNAPAEDDLGRFFMGLTQTCARATGSSLGTLVTVSMMTLGKRLSGQTEVSWAELPELIGNVRDAMMARGGAKLGDKTVIDMIDALAAATAGCTEPATMARRARLAADETLEVFRIRQNRIGRARMFGDETVGHDDPGMLACRMLVHAVTNNAAVEVSADG